MHHAYIIIIIIIRITQAHHNTSYCHVPCYYQPLPYTIQVKKLTSAARIPELRQYYFGGHCSHLNLTHFCLSPCVYNNKYFTYIYIGHILTTAISVYSRSHSNDIFQIHHFCTALSTIMITITISISEIIVTIV
jgi:hypothetical protein